MKNLLIAGLLLLNTAAIAKTTQAPNVSVTAATDDADSVMKGNSYIYGMDSNGDNRRVQVNTSGHVLTSGGGSGAAQAVSVIAMSAGTSIIGAVGVTSTTFPSWTLLSSTTRTISSPTIINLTSVAGATGVMKYQIGSSNSNSSGFYWGPRPDATWVAPRNYYSTSTTAFIDDYLTAGTHINLSPASATDISNTAEINIWKLTQVVP